MAGVSSKEMIKMLLSLSLMTSPTVIRGANSREFPANYGKLPRILKARELPRIVPRKTLKLGLQYMHSFSRHAKRITAAVNSVLSLANQISE